MFKLHRKDSFGTPSAVAVPATADVEYKLGMLLKADGTVCTASDTPKYVCGEEIKGVEGREIICFRILDDMELKTQLSAEGNALNVGDKVQISADGMTVTADTSNGVAEICGMEGTEIGDTVYVRF